MNDYVRVAPRIVELAERHPREESCGLVVEDAAGVLAVVPVPNVAGRDGGPGPEQAFQLDPGAHLAIARRLRAEGGRVIAVWHTHVDGPGRLSAADRAGAIDDGRPTLPGVDWIVVGMRSGKAEEIQAFTCTGARFVGSPVAWRDAAAAPGAKSRPS